MKKTKHLCLVMTCLLLATTTTSWAQKVQNYSGTKAFETQIGTVVGTEKYPYIVSDRGKKIMHGAYSFSGKDAEKSNRAEYSLTYTLNTNYKQGNLHGTYTMNENLVGKYYEFGEGWQSMKGSAKLTGTFADGKPAGTFTASYDEPGKLQQNGTVTMKNGKYVGSYYYKGNGYHCYEEIKGQLTSDGKLTGKWKYRDITGSVEIDWVFENDVLISSDNGSEVTPTAVQNIARQYAQGKISEEQLQDKGYIIKRRTLELDDFISYLVLDIGDYGFEKMEGWDFTEYKAKEYVSIEAPNSLSEAGFQYLITLVRGQGGEPQAKEIVTKDKYSIRQNPKWEDEGYFVIKCNPSFSEKFGYYTGTYYYVALNKKQYQGLTAVQDSMAIAYPRTFSTATFSTFQKDSSAAMRKLINSPSLRKSENESVRETLAFLNKSFTALPGYKGLIGEENSTISSTRGGYSTYPVKNSLAYGDTCYFTPDNKFMISRHSDEHIFAVSTDLVQSINAYTQAIALSEQMEDQIKKKVTSVNATLEKCINSTKNKANKNYYKQLKANYTTMVKTDDIVERDLISQETLLIISKFDSIARKNEQLDSNLPKTLKANYQRMFASFTSLPSFKSLAEMKKYTPKVNEFVRIQNDFVALNKICNEVESIHAELKTVCDAMPYKKQVKSYVDSYEAAKQILEMSSLKELDDQIQKMQQLQKEMSLCKEDLLTLNKEYTSVVETDAKLKEQCGKSYGDVYKAYKGIYDKGIQIQSISSIKDIESKIEEIRQLASEQQTRFNYIDLRKSEEQLNNDILNICASAKNCKRLYMALYKELPILWDESADNISLAQTNIKLLTSIKEQLSKRDLAAFDGQMKKVKKVEDFKAALDL